MNFNHLNPFDLVASMNGVEDIKTWTKHALKLLKQLKDKSYCFCISGSSKKESTFGTLFEPQICVDRAVVALSMSETPWISINDH